MIDIQREGNVHVCFLKTVCKLCLPLSVNKHKWISRYHKMHHRVTWHIICIKTDLLKKRITKYIFGYFLVYLYSYNK